MHVKGSDTEHISWSVDTAQGQYGHIVIDPVTGQWQYLLDNSNSQTNALSEGEQQSEQFIITATDNNGHKASSIIAVEVEGSNDLPTISGMHNATINSTGNIDNVSGTLTSSDPDHHDQSVWNVEQPNGKFGQLSINPDTGEWQYHLDNQSSSTLGLHSGQQASESFTVTATDSSGTPVSKEVTIVVIGKNEVAVISGVSTGSITEDKNLVTQHLSVTGQLSVTDTDTGESHFQASSLQGQFGHLVIDELGHWTYTANNTQTAIQELKTGELLTDTLLVHSVDGTEQKVTVTINGTDDKAVIAGTSTAQLTEDNDVHQGQLHVDGALTVTDLDNGQAQFSATSLQGQFGTLSINNLGHWTYTADNSQPNIQGLKTGESLTDTLLVHSVDGTEQKISVTINGTDDKAVISGTSSAQLTEDKNVHQGQLHVDGALTVTDVDSGQKQFHANILQGQFGNLSINDLGHWTYTANNSQTTIQGLKTGDSVTDTLVVHSVDGTEQKISVTINGTDDKAVITGVSTGNINEDNNLFQGQLRFDGQLQVKDPDTNQAHFLASNITGTYGNLSIDLSGSWTYIADNQQTAVQQLGISDDLTDSFIVKTADGTEQLIKVNICGHNDAAVINGVDTGSIQDSANAPQMLHANGKLSVIDVDLGQDHFQVQAISGAHGSYLDIKADGTWKYSVDRYNPDIIDLAKGAKLEERFIVHSADGTEHMIVTTVVGNNTPAIIVGQGAGVLREDIGKTQVTGTLSVMDPDANQSFFETATLQGTYGDLVINKQGQWHYDLNNNGPAVQTLRDNQVEPETFFIKSADGTPHGILINIIGTNDLAQIDGIDSGVIKEDVLSSGILQTQGKLIVTDIDAGEALFPSGMQQGNFGRLMMANNGSWHYIADTNQAGIQQLSQGDHEQDKFTVTSIDGTQHQVVIDINGTNDSAVIAGTSSGSVNEETQLQTSGTLTVTDTDRGEAHFSDTDIAGTFGILHLTDSGAWTYVLDNSNPRVQALAVNQTATDIITINSADGTLHQLTITVNGTNDKAVITGTSSGIVTEESQLQTSGALTITDTDTGEAHFSDTDITGTFGILHLTDSGAWTYDLDNTNLTVQALTANKTATDIITINSADGTLHQLTIKVIGTNDKAVIAGTIADTVKEESKLQTSGTLTVTDTDKGEAHFTDTDIVGTLGTLHLTFSGAWTYDLDNTNPTVQALAANKTVTDIITVNSTDGTPHQITITVNGTNDKAIISGTNTGSVTEESMLKASGQLTITDVDTDQDHFQNGDLTGSYGTLHLTVNGAWTYDLDNANTTVQALTDGSSLTEIITIKSADGTAQNISITVHGTNDAAFIGGTSIGAVVEESTLQSSNMLTISDADSGQDHFQSGDITGVYGKLHIDTDGLWTYNLDNSNSTVQALGHGDKLSETLTVKAADGTPHNIKVWVYGTNDTPIIGGSAAGSVTEESTLKASGQLTITDVDTDQDHFQDGDLIGNYGTLHLAANGAWTYDLDNTSVQLLGDGKSVTETITVKSTDGTAQDIVVTIHGTNDVPFIGGTSIGAVVEGSTLQSSNMLTIADMDGGQDHFQSVDIKGAYGKLHIDTDGLWTYDLDNNNSTVQALGHGDKLSETLTVKAADGTPHNIKVWVYGTNDAAMIGGSSAGSVTEESTLKANGQLTITDEDTNQDHFQDGNLTGSYGTLHLAANGAWTYDIDNSNPMVQALGQGKTAKDTITVHSADGTPHQISITVNGTNDTAVIAGTNSGIVTEETQLQTTGTLTVTDTDAGEALFSNTDIVGSLGTLHLTDSGAWTYDLDNTNPTVQALGQGSNATDVITVHSADGTPHQITIKVNGTDDKAVITGTSTAQLTEDKDVHQGQLHVDGALTVTDGDAGENQFQASVEQGQYGSLTLSELGHWTYTADNSQPSIQSLKTGEKVTDTLIVQSIDGTEQQITVTINGTDDKAVITGISTGDVDEGHGSFGDMSPDYAQPGMAKLGQAALTADGKLDIVDPDAGESQFDSKGGAWNNSYHGQYGHLLLNSDGTWHYDVTVGSVDWVGNRKSTIGSTIDKLGEGQTLTDTITIQSKDGTSHDIVITIHGDNDRPYCSSEVTLTSGTEDTAQTLTTADLLSNTVDVDANDAGKLTIENLVSDHGSILDNKDGTFTFTPEKDYNGAVHFSYDVKDAHGGVTHTGATTSLSAVRDAAVIGGVDTGDITENSAGINMSPDQAHAGMATLGQKVLYASGQLTILDPDKGEAEFGGQSASGYNYHGSYGDLILNKDGSWDYHADLGRVSHIGGRPTTRGTAIDKLGEGETLTDTITIHAKDGTTHDIVITIHGSNDRPYCSSEVQLNSGKEDTAQTLTAADLLTNTVDVDANDAGKLSIENLVSDHGSILDNKDGTFTFTPEKDYNGAVHFSYDVKDAHGGITHTGASTSLTAVRDAATFTGDDTGAVKEDTATSKSGAIDQLVASGTLAIHDPDGPQEESFDFKSYGEHAISDPFGGNLHISQAGSWSYVVDNNNPALQALKEGETRDVVYRVTSRGYSTHEITITVTGTNDAPVVTSSVNLNSGTEDTAVTLNTVELLANATDIDTGESAQLTVANLVAVKPDGTVAGSVTDNHDGTFTFNPEANYNGSVTFNYEVQDPHAATTSTMATMSLAAVVDESIITGIDTASVKEDVNVSNNAQVHDLIASGSLSVSDPDGGQNYFLFSQFGEQAVSDPFNGMLHLDASGNWEYAVENFQLQELREGQVEHAIYKVQSADGTYHNINITIIGTNDTPVVSSAVGLVDGSEDTSVVLHASDLLAHATDVDTGETTQLSVHNLVAVKPDGTSAGAITDNHDGTFTFVPEANYNGTVDFNYAVQDTHGGTVNTTAFLTLDSVSDIATFSGDSSGITKDDDTAVSGLLTVTDPDAGEDEFKVQTNVDGSYGKFSITANGHWNYMPDDRADGIASGQSPQETFTVESIDGTKQSVIVTITGSNDVPIVIAANASRAVDLGATELDTAKTFTEAELLKLVDASDIDGDTLHITDISSTHGNFSKDVQSGEWTFTPEKHYHGIYIPVSLKVSDGSAETIAHGTIDVNESHPAPYITGTSTGDITEANATIQLDPITSDNIINAQESATDIGITGQVSGDVHQGDSVSLVVGQHSYSASVDGSGHFSVNIAGSELASNSSITASVVTTDSAGNSASASQVMHYSSDTHVGMPTITFENPGSDKAYSKAEIAQGHAGTVTATVHAAADAQVGEHLSINGVDHVLDANSLAHGINLEVAPSSIVRAIMTDEHGNVNSALNIAASAKPEPIVVTAPPGSHHIGASLGVPTLIPTQTPVPTAQQGWKILVNGHYQTSYTSQWGTLTINPKTGQLNYQEHANTHTGPHGSAQNVGVHEDKFEVALQGSHHDDVIMHVQVSILSHGPGHSGKLTLGSEVLDMTVTPTITHSAPPPPPTAADANDAPQNDAIADISVDLHDILVDDAAVHTGQDTQSSDDATVQAQTEAETESTSQPLSPTPVTAAAVSTPIDHYLNMVGISQADIAPTNTAGIDPLDLPGVPEMAIENVDADMLDVSQGDAFENPLDDEHHQQHKDELLTDLNDQPDQSDINQANDDDLLHQALNDMHNQV
ncbi:VCBS domain-containing protein [Shewanella sp. 10N.7]|uniref:VCBS domain-containing protein n=1 Tax=Shewanella sp. 10N.7 TaxID=2885093 RepID=UPI001E3B3FBA|nr:VCBS domain-containing protein [Shewanella sp. 10N.7]MCC4834184.1 VCBS domain-containing protein [Shewanella sp. 10N.7]